MLDLEFSNAFFIHETYFITAITTSKLYVAASLEEGICGEGEVGEKKKNGRRWRRQ